MLSPFRCAMCTRDLGSMRNRLSALGNVQDELCFYSETKESFDGRLMGDFLSWTGGERSES